MKPSENDYDFVGRVHVWGKVANCAYDEQATTL
jgi:hypothetical protein